MKHLLKDIDLSKSPADERALIYGYVDLIAFGKIFLPGDFKKKPDAEYQHTVAAEINSTSFKPCAIILPRGHIKTTIIRASIVHDMCYHKEAMLHFAKIASSEQIKEFWLGQAYTRTPRLYAWVAKSQTDAENNIRYVSKSLRNQKIGHYFGMGRGFKSDSRQDGKWNLQDIVTNFNDRLISASNIKSVRGFTETTEEHGAIRFYRVFADDFENEENTKTYMSREGLKNTLLASIMPAIENDIVGARLFLVGTPVHFDALIQNILDDWYRIKDDPVKIAEYSWVVLTWKATQPDMPGGVLWQGGAPREFLDRRKKEYFDRQKEHLYFQEYELEVQSEDESKWTRKHIMFHDGVYKWDKDLKRSFLMIEGQWLPVNTFGGVDPATDIDTQTADESAIVIIAMDVNTNIYVLTYRHHRNIPTLSLRDNRQQILDGREGILDIMLGYQDQFHLIHTVVEDVAMNRGVFQDLAKGRSNPSSILYNRWGDFRVLPEEPAGKGSKRSRIYSSMNERFTSQKVHVRKTHDELIDEIIMLGPRMARDNIIEALHLACLRAYPPKPVDYAEYDRDRPKQKRKKSWVAM